MLEKSLMINRIQGIENLLDPDQFLKLLNSIRAEVADIMKFGDFFLETYTLPKNYIEFETALSK